MKNRQFSFKALKSMISFFAKFSFVMQILKSLNDKKIIFAQFLPFVKIISTLLVKSFKDFCLNSFKLTEGKKLI